MSYSIMQAGQSTKSKATGSLKTLSDLEQNRELRNDQAEQQKKNNQISGAGAGAMAGATYGSSMGP